MFLRVALCWLLTVSVLVSASCHSKEGGSKHQPESTQEYAEKNLTSEKQRLINKLVYSARRGNKEGVLAALEAGANINGFNKKDMTALMEASVNGYFDLVRLLVEKGADIRMKNRDGQQAIRFATFFGHPEIIEFLIEHGEQVDNINDRNAYLLYAAARHESPTTLQILLRNGIQVQNYYRKDYESTTPMHAAASICGIETLKILNHQGALINIHDKFDGNTPLITAAKNNCMDAIVYLVENGADVNDANKVGDTALIFSAFHGNTEAVAYLLEKGADATYKNSYDETALDTATRQVKRMKPDNENFKKTIELLKQYAKAREKG